jgi:uncharacterized protein YdaU (DUF1376 family)
LNHFRFHIGDYVKDTSHLSLLEHGVYLRLIHVYYTREAPIPEDQAARLVGARSPEEREALAVVLKEFFRVADGACHQSRCQAEIDEWHLLSAEQAVKGRAGAAKRWAEAKNGSGQKKHGKGHSAGYPKDSSSHDPAIEKNGRSIASQLPTPNSIQEGDLSKELPAAGEERRASPPKARGSSRVPEDFVPDLSYARAQVPDMDVEREAQKFRDWEFKTPRKDWPATWRTWVSRCRETGKYARAAATTGGTRGLERLVVG